MSRLFIDDATRKDPRALITTGKLARITDITAPTEQYIVASGDNQVKILAGCAVTVDSGAFFSVDTDTVIGAANLDTGTAFAVGKDYYIYVCDSGSLSDGERFVISLNSTFPTGWTAAASRKLGGFHFGKCRRVNAKLLPINTSGTEKGTGWESNVYDGILPHSVWTIYHRPKCKPEGMVYMGGSTWVDIYLASDDGAGGISSAFGKTPLTGTEGLHWYGFAERALVSGKRLLTYQEWCQAALGSPQGLDAANTNAWTATSNGGRTTAGNVAYAVSSIGCCDCVGNVWEWLDEFIHDPTATTGAWQDPMAGQGYGKLYMYSATGLHAFLAGGSWGTGVSAGARAVYLSLCPWYVGTDIGARGACDCL